MELWQSEEIHLMSNKTFLKMRSLRARVLCECVEAEGGLLMVLPCSPMNVWSRHKDK